MINYQNQTPTNLHLFLFIIFLAILAIFPMLTPSPSYDPFNPTGAAAPDYAKTPFLMLSTLFILGISFLTKFNQQIIWKNSSILILFILFLSWATLSIFWSFNFFFNTFFLSKWYAGFFAMVFLNLYLKDEKQINQVIITILLASAASQLLGIIQAYNITPNWIAKLVPQAIPPASTFGNRNMSMHFLILTAPLLIYFALFTKKIEVKISMFILMAIFLSYLIFSLNRTSWLGFSLQIIMGIILFIIFIRPIRVKLAKILNLNILKVISFIIALISIVIVMIFISTSDKKENITNRFKTVEKNTKTGKTENPREIQFINTLHMIKDVFIPGSPSFITGLGMGQWTIYYPKYMGSNQVQASMHPLLSKSNILYKQTHNEYLQIFAELGIIGFSIFIAIVVLLILHVFRLLQFFFKSNDEENYRRGFLVGLLFLSFTGISLNLLLSFPLRVGVPLPLMLIYFVIIEFYYRTFIVDKITLTPNKINHSNKSIPIKNKSKTNASVHNNHYSFKSLLTLIFQHKDIKIPSYLNLFLSVLCFITIYFMYNQYQVWEKGHRARNIGAARIQGLSKITNEQTRKNALNQIRRDLSKAIQIVPSDPDDASFILANLYRTQKRYHKSIEVIENVLNNIHPYHIYMYRVLVSNYIQTKQYSKAIQTLEKATKNFSNISIFYKDIGQLLYQFNKKKESIPYYKKALQLDPNVQGYQRIQKIIKEMQANQ